jgi:uroporphyrinogen-III synthase
VRVWVTRTQPGAAELAESLKSSGFECFTAPVLGVEDTGNPAPDGEFDIAVVASRHAVAATAGVLAAIPTCIAVGASTAAALAQCGVIAIVPEAASSEGLLELDAVAAVAGTRVLIVAGEGGRRVIDRTLRERGASIVRWEAYRRGAVPVSGLCATAIDAIVVGSGDGFRAAARLWFDAQGDPEIPVVVPSARVARLGTELGLGQTINCGSAAFEAIRDALVRLS